MVWKQAHDEIVKAIADAEKAEEELFRKAMEDVDKINSMQKLFSKDEDKPILKKFYRVLANTYHPDNKETGDTNMMKYVNNLKVLWGLS